MRRLLAAALLLAVSTMASAEPGGHRARTAIVPFETTPFPYTGSLPDEPDKPFLNVNENGRLGHKSPHGLVQWADAAYASRGVLISVPAAFNPRKPAVLVVYFHGNNAKLERDVWHRQRIVEQVARSHLNAILVAPQFAVDAHDSSAGNFWRPGVFARFLDEATNRTATLAGEAGLADKLRTAPVLLAAYSGGYDPAAYSLSVGGAANRVCGVLLFDALFGEAPRFADWIAKRPDAFFVSAYSKTSKAQNEAFQTTLQAGGNAFRPQLEAHGALAPGVTFEPAIEAEHKDFMTRAWTIDPLRALLSRVRTCR